jgi:hypothetical protein
LTILRTRRSSCSKYCFSRILSRMASTAFPSRGCPTENCLYGPCPADYPRIQQEMVRDNHIKIFSRRAYDHSSQRLLPLRRPDFDVLSARDISVVDGWILAFWNMTAKQVSEYSHGKAWKIAGESELIPYEAVFISDEPVTFEDSARAKELTARLGWKQPPR